jgi:hypothetical protein
MSLRPAAFGTALLVLLLPPGHQTGPRDILGHWHGTSICVRFSENAACNDEEVFYEFVADGPDSTHLILHAAKRVGDKPEPMGDLGIVYDPARAEWNGDFANARVSLRWTYRIRQDTLRGEVVLLPKKQVARHVVALRSGS